MPRTRRRPSCHPEREHAGRGLCSRCYWVAYTAGEFVARSKKARSKKACRPRAEEDELDLEPALTPEQRAEEHAFEARMAFERGKADRRRRARKDADERRARNRLPPRHPLFADRPLLREMQRLGCVSWNTVEQIRQLRQQAGWSIKDLAALFGLRPSFVALATSHLDLNIIDSAPAERFTA
jgi:ribosome-binding protein aMBF1 (putative translation factor)